MHKTMQLSLRTPIVIIYIRFSLLGENVTGLTRVKRNTETQRAAGVNRIIFAAFSRGHVTLRVSPTAARVYYVNRRAQYHP